MILAEVFEPTGLNLKVKFHAGEYTFAVYQNAVDAPLIPAEVLQAACKAFNAVIAEDLKRLDWPEVAG
jgi:hypothetical protein